jgi:hypothetical protein
VICRAAGRLVVRVNMLGGLQQPSTHALPHPLGSFVMVCNTLIIGWLVGDAWSVFLHAVI